MSESPVLQMPANVAPEPYAPQADRRRMVAPASGDQVQQTPAVPAADQARQFLDLLFAGKDPGEHILIWLLRGRRSAWFADTAAAAVFVEAHRTQDVYVGVALSPKDHGPNLRLKIESGERLPSSIVGLWADLDVQDGVHKKQNLPPTLEDAKALLFPELPPSILIHSGGGFQAWWLFKEPWILDSEAEVRKAAALAKRWIGTIQARAHAKRWDVDSVEDLPRILRIPGTFNCKQPEGKPPIPPRPVRLLEINDHRYNPSDIDEYLDTIGAAKTTVVIPPAALTAGATRLNYDTNAKPPFDKFYALCENETKFRMSWNHKRRDLKDQSISAYDMSFANMAVQASWTDQEITNLMIAHRRKYLADLKLRDSYYVKSIAKARASQTLQ